jgi:V/A-type H+-transporting ATPase subunit D
VAKLALNKSSLSQEKNRKTSYGRYLPSLEMKQKQLLGERKKAELELEQHRHDIDNLESKVYQRLPKLAVKNIDMFELVAIEDVKISEENFLGIRMPSLVHVSFKRKAYGFLARPHWFDELADSLEKVMHLKLLEQLLAQRLQKLQAAVLTITQRVNLFSKVLIPEAETNIKRISLFLADQERAAVVRSKLAKKKHELKKV